MFHRSHLSQPHRTPLIQTGFEFKNRRAFPVINGIVVAAENESTLLEVNRFHGIAEI